jgi:hypothetical protein
MEDHHGSLTMGGQTKHVQDAASDGVTIYNSVLADIQLWAIHVAAQHQLPVPSFVVRKSCDNNSETIWLPTYKVHL